MPPELTPAGQPILRHAAVHEGPLQDLAPDDLEAIGSHIAEHLGPVEVVFHEVVSDLVHIDVHWVAKAKVGPLQYLVTSGMSARPMNVPSAAGDAPRFAEVLVCLPASWVVSDAAFKDEANYWPVRLLKTMARLPHQFDTWLGYGHSVPNGDPAAPYAMGTRFSGALVLPPVTVPSEFHRLRLRDRQVAFFAVVPIYREEMELKLQRGTEALLDRFDREGVTDVVDVRRRNVARKFLGLF